MRLADYLARIGYHETPRADLATLTAISQAQLRSVPFENLDVQLGAPLTPGVEQAYAKIVERRRGGWCYELNGVLGWALGEIGFAVTRVGGIVMRGDDVTRRPGDHLALLVECEGRRWLVDAGFGGKQAGPLPLAEGERNDPPFTVSLRRTGDVLWRFEECDRDGAAFNFDFSESPADDADLAARCHWLQSDPESPFVRTLTVQMRGPDEHLALRGRTLTTTRVDGVEVRDLDQAEWTALLRNRAGLDVDHLALWAKTGAACPGGA